MLLLAAVAILWSAFSYWQEYAENSARRARELLAPPVGSHCRVVFSSADLGIEPMPPNAADVSGVSNCVSGRLSAQGAEWIVLDQEAGGSLWIPRERILVIEIEP